MILKFTKQAMTITQEEQGRVVAMIYEQIARSNHLQPIGLVEFGPDGAVLEMNLLAPWVPLEPAISEQAYRWRNPF